MRRREYMVAGLRDSTPLWERLLYRAHDIPRSLPLEWGEEPRRRGWVRRLIRRIVGRR